MMQYSRNRLPFGSCREHRLAIDRQQREMNLIAKGFSPDQADEIVEHNHPYLSPTRDRRREAA